MKPTHKKSFSEGSDFMFGMGGSGRGLGVDGEKDKLNNFEYFGWVYHLGVNSIGHDYCHLRFLFIRNKYVEMYKRDPHEYPGIKPIRKGVIRHTFMLEDLGVRKVHHGEVYVLRFSNRLDETKKGEIACATASEAQKWLEAFEQAKQQAEYELSRVRSTRDKLNMADELNLEGHRPRVRRYAHGLRKLIRIGQGPEPLLRQSPSTGANIKTDGFFEGDMGDAIEGHDWKCVRTVNGIRIFEDISDAKNGKGTLVKSVGVVDCSADTVFEVILNLDRQKRYEWDMFTGDLELVDTFDGNYDIVYGTADPKYLTRWQSKKDFVFSRQWFRGQDGTYTILQFPAVHKKQPTRSGYKRTKINPSTWEIRNLNMAMGSNSSRCLVAQTLEIYSSSWFRWKQSGSSKFEKTVAFALLSQVAGLKEYIEANPALKFESSILSKFSDASNSNSEYEDADVQDEFYDATDDETDSDDDELLAQKEKSAKQSAGPDANELDSTLPSTSLDPSQFNCSMRQGKDDDDKDCWASASGTGFMIRGKSYLQDNGKIKGGEPLLKCVGVDWFKADSSEDKVALHPKYLVQSEAGKKLPFILIINLQIPSKPNYNLVIYYAADRPISQDSLLGKFVDGEDTFRDSRFKLIPSIVEGYWMVKRAVGTKACLLGKAVTCNYLRQDNFLEVDVDIGSSSVARSIIGLVLGYVTSLVVDLAILIEAREEAELPEYVLGTVRLNRVKLDSAVPYEV